MANTILALLVALLTGLAIGLWFGLWFGQRRGQRFFDLAGEHLDYAMDYLAYCTAWAEAIRENNLDLAALLAEHAPGDGPETPAWMERALERAEARRREGARG